MSVFNSPSDRAPFGPSEQRRPVAPGVPPPVEGAPRRASVLGKTLIFKGELSADEDLVLQGRVEGSIHHTQSLTVGVDGVVIGDVHARSIVVEGTVEGDLHGGASVVVAATAKVRGNIVSPRVGIMEGAHFNGAIDMSGAPAAAEHGRAEERSRGALAEQSVERILNRI
ncbi:MAG TPA: polymer-forming cytoskeletal protein [Steroidobacteraceae bacterium]|nr:polymer-forming cytoskeletal protein [Steroidobacteraceae bacterium]